MLARLLFMLSAAFATALPWTGTSAQDKPLSQKLAPFDCAGIQGPEKNDFYEENGPIKNSIDYTQFGQPSNPETEGMNSALLLEAAEQLDSLHGSNVLSFLVIRNNRLIFERYFHGADKTTSNNVHSAAKSILSAAIGIAINHGLIALDTKIADLLPQFGGKKNGKAYPEIKDARKRSITVKHLLTMSSGIQWIEDETEHTIEDKPDRVRAILDLPFVVRPAKGSSVEPGQIFNYSTGNSHLLSAVLEEALEKAARQQTMPKQNVCQFVHEHLLKRIGIEAERWGRDPQGYFSGGFNLYLTPRELATFGMLYLNDGKFQGQQIIPRKWVDDSLTPNPEISMRAHDSPLPDGYGYYFWLASDIWLGDRRRGDPLSVAIAWGHGGQMVYIIKDLELVVVITRDTRAVPWNAIFGRSEKTIAEQLESVIKQKIIPAASRP